MRSDWAKRSDALGLSDAPLASPDHPRGGPVRDGARLERHERLDLADRRRPRHDRDGRPDRDHRLHARDGCVHARRSEAGRHLGVAIARSRSGSRSTASVPDDRLEPEPAVLLFGWSLVEGLGAVLVIPAIAALVAANYEGKQRAFAYGIIGGVAGAAIAVGPVIGGWVTTYYSWRLVFVGRGRDRRPHPPRPQRMQPSPRPEHPPKLDIVGAALSAAGWA